MRLLNGEETAESAEIEAFLTEKFGSVLQPEVYFRGLMPTAGGPMAKLLALKPVKFGTSGGWLTLAYSLDDK